MINSGQVPVNNAKNMNVNENNSSENLIDNNARSR